ncbi:hypothetical protein [Listeria costaricensis]|uniref:hypothetical protein n=1 Tax=Listeria costaricensis TaxID=2026604 RepID=UPI001F0910E6|nr:hypothetical protein [Listeria costaricensis]
MAIRIFAGVLSLQAAIIGFFTSYKPIKDPVSYLMLIPETLSRDASWILSVVMFLAGILVICAQKNDFLLFLAMVLWAFGLILGLLFCPTYSGFYFRPSSCAICLIISFYVFTDYRRSKHNQT